MKLVSFNVNGIRARMHQLAALVERYAPDVIGLQETKVQDPDFPVADVESLGYELHYFGQKGHYGVAMLSKLSARQVQKGFPGDEDDAQKRIVSARFGLPDGSDLVVVNGYFPQGESRDHPTKFPAKQKFYSDLCAYLENDLAGQKHVIVMGDFNIAPIDLDIGIGDDNAKRWLRTGKTSFLPEEREWFERLLACGLQDTYRHLFPSDGSKFSWFDYRSRGFEADPKRGLRIDGILASPAMLEKCIATEIAYDIRAMDKPSDHCPVIAEFSI